jgi:hypothetical protein
VRCCHLPLPLEPDHVGAMQVDLLADDECFKQLKACGAVCMASSEETSEEVFCSGRYEIPPDFLTRMKMHTYAFAKVAFCMVVHHEIVCRHTLDWNIHRDVDCDLCAEGTR